MLRRLRANFRKDIKQLFRNWASLFLIIIGPLILMLIIMFAFSDIGFSDIRIGHTSVDGTRFSTILPKISYMGNFIEYNSIEECQQDLKTQKLHLCMEPTKSVLNVHFDNSRELISLILLNQMRTAVSIEKEVIMEQQAQGFLGEVQGLGSFMRQSELFSDLLLADLQEHRKELVDTRNDLEDAQDEIRDRRIELERLRDTLASSFAGAQSIVESEVDSTLFYLDQADSALYSAYLGTQGVDATVSSQLLVLRDNVQSSRSQIIQSKNQLDQGYDQVNDLIRRIDDAIDDLRDAEDFLEDKERTLSNAISTIDTRSRELRDLQSRIRAERSKVDKVGRLDVNELVNPIDLNYMPLFVGSKRLTQLNFGFDLSADEKQRLINFGTIQTFLPLILSLLICFIATILGNIMVLDEIHSPAFSRNRIAPVNWFVPLLSRFVTVFVVTLIQAAVILGIGYFVFYLDLAGSVGALFVVLFLLIGTYSLVGMIIAYLIRSKTTSLLVSSFFLIITLLLGGIFYPVERMAPFMTYISKAIPFTSGISMLQQSLFYNISFTSLLVPLFRLLGLLLAGFIILYFSRKIFIHLYQKGK